MRVFWLPLAASALVATVSSSRAMPLGAEPAVPEAGITLASDGCGPFGHRSHYGYCKDNENPEYSYAPHSFHRGGYGGGYGPGPGFYDDGGYRPRRCFIRETYDGPVRVCR